MIRRDLLAADGTRQWLLIEQVAHARLAGQLAESWGTEPFRPLEPRPQVLEAIYHHDDGWPTWDAAPDVDPESGAPLAFNEMPLGESLAIWRHSITNARRRGDLVAYAVAGHFCALLRRFDSWKSTPAKQRLATKFLEYYDGQMTVWLAQWSSDGQPGHTPTVAAQAVAQLQFFDALSLWLCCAERTEAERFDSPGGPSVTFTPKGQNCLAVGPWPWTVDRLSLSVTGRKIVAERYADAQALANVPSQDHVVEWRFERSG